MFHSPRMDSIYSVIHPFFGATKALSPFPEIELAKIFDVPLNIHRMTYQQGGTSPNSLMTFRNHLNETFPLEEQAPKVAGLHTM